MSSYNILCDECYITNYYTPGKYDHRTIIPDKRVNVTNKNIILREIFKHYPFSDSSFLITPDNDKYRIIVVAKYYNKKYGIRTIYLQQIHLHINYDTSKFIKHSERLVKIVLYDY
jgi:hypothetical protein